MTSPFRYRVGVVQEEPVEKTIEMSDINQLVIIEALNEIDLGLLKCIHENRFITAGIVDQLYKNESYASVYFAKKRMRKFRAYGLVRRFYITFDCPGDIQDRTVNFYCLTDAAMKYLKKYFNSPSYVIYDAQNLNTGEVLATLSLNQMTSNYVKKGIAKIEQTRKDKDTRECHMQFMDGAKFIVCSIRGDQRLDALLGRINSDRYGDDSMYLLVEDEVAATEIYKKLLGKTLRSLRFITDYMMVSDDMYSSYLMVAKKELNYVINEFKLVNS